jgi:conjugal transfer/entry exclusion protein
VFIVANQILELTGLDDIILGDDFASDMEELADIVQEAQGLSYDISSLVSQVNALFSLDRAPNNMAALRERLAEIRRVTFQSYLYAMRTQTLLATTLRTVQRLTRLVQSIGGFVGNMSANQTLNQVDSTITEQLAKLQVQTAAYERAQSVERLEEALIVESLERITEEIMQDWPRQ